MTFKSIALTVIGLALAGSVAARAISKDEDPKAASPKRTGAPHDLVTDFVPKTPAPVTKPESDGMARALPIVSEASFFAFIGFALGYVTRKVLKLAMIFVALIFVSIQGLSYAGVVTVDWTRALDLVNTFVLNIKENQSVAEILKDRIPTAGALATGYFLGFRKG